MQRLQVRGGTTSVGAAKPGFPGIPPGEGWAEPGWWTSAATRWPYLVRRCDGRWLRLNVEMTSWKKTRLLMVENILHLSPTLTQHWNKTTKIVLFQILVYFKKWLRQGKKTNFYCYSICFSIIFCHLKLKLTNWLLLPDAIVQGHVLTVLFQFIWHALLCKSYVDISAHCLQHYQHWPQDGSRWLPLRLTLNKAPSTLQINLLLLDKHNLKKSPNLWLCKELWQNITKAVSAALLRDKASTPLESFH